MNRDHLTYRHPRTLNEAFGPDADGANPIEGPEYDPMLNADRPVMVACALVAVFLVVGASMGWLR